MRVFDLAFIVSHTLSKLLGRRSPLFFFIDSYSLFQTITTESSIREKRLFIDLAIPRQAFYGKSVDNIGFVRSEYNLADCLTKEMNSEKMDEVASSG